MGKSYQIKIKKKTEYSIHEKEWMTKYIIIINSLFAF